MQYFAALVLLKAILLGVVRIPATYHFLTIHIVFFNGL